MVNGLEKVTMECHSRNLREIAMESSNTKNRDSAIQRLVDDIRIAAENRAAATSALLQLIRRYEALSPDRSFLRDEAKRFQRISKLCNDLLKELDDLSPTSKLLIFEPKHSDGSKGNNGRK